MPPSIYATVKFTLLILFITAPFYPLEGRAEEASESVRRFGIFIGSNDGGSDRVRLRYAGSDALSVASVMNELGGIARADKILLLDPDRADVSRAFDEMRGKVESERSKHRRSELIVYYSGHSDEDGILLYGRKLSYKEFRELAYSVPADVRIVVLDSCSSGALVLQKGGKQRQSFLVDKSVDVKGHAILASSSSDEVSQESDKIKGSFFTHYLVSGLRGAADDSRDGIVTLNEAYRFAFNETISRTETTKGGAQHPTYDIQLVGTGDLVMTDLRATTAVLILDAHLSGRFYIRNEEGKLMVELGKTSGRIIDLGLEPGNYTITLDYRGVLYRAKATLREGDSVTLTEKNFRIIEGEPTVARGGGFEGQFAASIEVSPEAEATASPVPIHIPGDDELISETPATAEDMSVTRASLSPVSLGIGHWVTGFRDSKGDTHGYFDAHFELGYSLDDIVGVGLDEISFSMARYWGGMRYKLQAAPYVEIFHFPKRWLQLSGRVGFPLQWRFGGQAESAFGFAPYVGGSMQFWIGTRFSLGPETKLFVVTTPGFMFGWGGLVPQGAAVWTGGFSVKAHF